MSYKHLDELGFFFSGFWHSPYVHWYFRFSGMGGIEAIVGVAANLSGKGVPAHWMSAAYIGQEQGGEQ